MKKFKLTRRHFVGSAAGFALTTPSLAQTALKLPASPVTLNIIDVAGNLALTQPAFENYRKAKPNRFAKRMKTEPFVVIIEPDIAKVFTTPEQVNKALRALITAMPQRKVKQPAK